MSRIPTPTRSGITLVELTVTLGVTSTIMAMSAVLLGGLLERERLGRAELQNALAISQLAEQFRTDARGATACRVPPSEDADSVANWSFVRPNAELVRYEAQTRRLLRTELRGGQVARRESYAVPAGSRCRLALESAEKVQIVGLIFDRDTAAAEIAPARELHIETVLGWDRRFQGSSERGANP